MLFVCYAVVKFGDTIGIQGIVFRTSSTQPLRARQDCGKCVAESQRHVPLACDVVSALRSFRESNPLTGIFCRGDRIRLINTTLTVGRRAESVRTEVSHTQGMPRRGFVILNASFRGRSGTLRTTDWSRLAHTSRWPHLLLRPRQPFRLTIFQKEYRSNVK